MAKAQPYQWQYVKEELVELPNGSVISDFGWSDLLRKGMQPMFDNPNMCASMLGMFTKKLPELEEFVKADAPLQTSTTAALNPIYGQTVYSQLNNDVSFFAAIGKQPWTTSGIRVKTANSSSLVTGLDETDALPASTLPTYALIKFPLKQCVTRLDWTAKMQRQSVSGDDAIPTPAQLKMDKTEEHALGLNLALLANAETVASNASANYSGVTLFEALDRIISCDAEEDDLGGDYSGFYDPWTGSATIDRDSGTTYDSVVVHGDGTNCYQTGNPDFTTDVTINLDAKDELVKQCLKNGLKKSNGFWLTGWDTYYRLKQIYEVKERYMNPARVTMSVNGVTTVNGSEVGFEISTMDDMPIIIDNNCPKDTIDKLYLIDRSSIFLRVATPTTAINLGYPAFSTIGSTLAQRLGYGEVLLTEGELVATRFNTSGKLCALK